MTAVPTNAKLTAPLLAMGALVNTTKQSALNVGGHEKVDEFAGARKTIALDALTRSAWRRSGAVMGSEAEKKEVLVSVWCKACLGSGQVTYMDPRNRPIRRGPCPDCEGSGHVAVRR